MSGFKRSFLGYRRSEVDAELAARFAAMAATERTLATCRGRVDELDAVARRLSEQVVQRDRELRAARAELRDLRADGEQGVKTLAALGRQLEEIRAQARSQATQIRLRALRDAAELVERVSDVARTPANASGRVRGTLDDATPGTPGSPEQEPRPGSRNGRGAPGANGLFEGRVNVDVGPLSDFSQLARLEDAAGAIGAASEISIKRFSRGRATLAMRFSEPVELLRELEQRCDLEFEVRSLNDNTIVLDVDEEE